MVIHVDQPMMSYMSDILETYQLLKAKSAGAVVHMLISMNVTSCNLQNGSYSAADVLWALIKYMTHFRFRFWQDSSRRKTDRRRGTTNIVSAVWVSCSREEEAGLCLSSHEQFCLKIEFRHLTWRDVSKSAQKNNYTLNSLWCLGHSSTFRHKIHRNILTQSFERQWVERRPNYGWDSSTVKSAIMRTVGQHIATRLLEIGCDTVFAVPGVSIPLRILAICRDLM